MGRAATITASPILGQGFRGVSRPKFTLGTWHVEIRRFADMWAEQGTQRYPNRGGERTGYATRSAKPGLLPNIDVARPPSSGPFSYHVRQTGVDRRVR